MNIQTGNYIIIGGDSKDEIVKWGEQQEIGLATGYEGIDILEDGVLINLENKIIPFESIFIKLNNREEYLNWFINKGGCELPFWRGVFLKEQILNINENKEQIMLLLDRFIEDINSKDIYDKIFNMKEVPFNIEVKEGINLENNIYEDENKKLYLLESRLFDDNDENGRMYDAYLRVMDYEFNIIDEYIDDVWNYADWQRIE